MDKNEFDIDFDFEKEYGFDPDMLLDEEDGFNDADFDEFRDTPRPVPQARAEEYGDDDEDDFEEFDLDEAFSELDLDGEDFDINAEDLNFDAEDFGLGETAPEASEEADDEDLDFDLDEEDEELDFELTEEDLLAGEPEFLQPKEPQTSSPAAEPAFAVDEVPEEFQMPEEFQSSEDAPEAQEPADPEENRQPERRRTDAPRNPRRKKRSQMRVFKEVYLPAIIAGVALILIVTFIIGSIVNAVNRNKLEDEAAIKASESEQNEQQRIDNEARSLMNQAAVLAAGYDYEAAATLLDTFSGDMSKYPDMITAKSSYVQMQNQMVEHRDPALIPNLSFHLLIADPVRAFTDKEWGGQYNRNFVTTDEFEKILQQLYDNDYVLVDFDSFLQENQDTYFAETIYLPADKKPIMITETMVNYYNYMIDSDDDGQYGDGFARRLVVAEDGSIQAEMLDASGNTVTGAYDLVPILENFIQAHPDFSYRGARATLAVTGDEGVFGYRINSEVQSTKGQDYYDEQVAGAKTVVQALRDKGYTIASYTYSNKDYYKYTAAQVATEMTNWTNQITPVLGDVDIMVFAQQSDIREYSGTKFNTLYDAGFRIFVGKGTTPWAEIATSNTYVHQNRLMVTGNTMAWSSTTFSSYFDSKAILNSLRGDVPN